MTSKEVVKGMLPYNVVGVFFVVIGVLKSHGFFALAPLCLSLAWTIFLLWAVKRKGRSSDDKAAEE